MLASILRREIYAALPMPNCTTLSREIALMVDEEIAAALAECRHDRGHVDAILRESIGELSNRIRARISEARDELNAKLERAAGRRVDPLPRKKAKKVDYTISKPIQEVTAATGSGALATPSGLSIFDQYRIEYGAERIFAGAPLPDYVTFQVIDDEPVWLIHLSMPGADPVQLAAADLRLIVVEMDADGVFRITEKRNPLLVQPESADATRAGAVQPPGPQVVFETRQVTLTGAELARIIGVPAGDAHDVSELLQQERALMDQLVAYQKEQERLAEQARLLALFSCQLEAIDIEPGSGPFRPLELPDLQELWPQPTPALSTA